jgi:vancomycin permeability regulator SanA
MVSHGFDANIWWIDVRFLSPYVGPPVLAAAGFFMLAYAVCPAMAERRRFTTLISVGIVAVIACANAMVFYVLLTKGRIDAGVPVPLSMVVLLMLVSILWAVRRTATPARCRRFTVALTVMSCLIAGPILQMYFFGKTEYRRQADAIVVFGARAYADGRPSDALADRVRTACGLYHEGVADYLVFSGGPGDGLIHETESMRRFAIQHGVPGEAIVVDEQGLNTQATVHHTARIFEHLNIRRVIVVSHFYHLPRIKMTYQRSGIDVYTMPASESYTLTQLPWNIAREVAAIWVYYVRPLADV